jgi:hypothetical protein
MSGQLYYLKSNLSKKLGEWKRFKEMKEDKAADLIILELLAKLDGKIEDAKSLGKIIDSYYEDDPQENINIKSKPQTKIVFKEENEVALKWFWKGIQTGEDHLEETKKLLDFDKAKLIFKEKWKKKYGVKIGK